MEQYKTLLDYQENKLQLKTVQTVYKPKVVKYRCRYSAKHRLDKIYNRYNTLKSYIQEMAASCEIEELQKQLTTLKIERDDLLHTLYTATISKYDINHYYYYY